MATLDSNQVRGTTRNHTVRLKYVKEELNLYQCGASRPQSTKHCLVINLTIIIVPQNLKVVNIFNQLYSKSFLICWINQVNSNLTLH